MNALDDAAAMRAQDALSQLASKSSGLSNTEASKRLLQYGPNTIHTHHFTVFSLLLGQFKNPILILLAVAAIASGLLGDAGNASVIGGILVLSVTLSLVTEFRAEKASADLQKRTTHRATVIRDGQPQQLDVTKLVPGDIVRLSLGAVIPADLRLMSTDEFECDESIITGESMPVEKAAESDDVAANCALMGTVVRAGSATGLVIRTGGQTEFGAIAQGLSKRVPETDFQMGLRKFSVFLLRLALGMCVVVIGASAILHHNLIDAVLFALALAVGMTPQLLPAVVSTALALGSRQLAKDGVLVKRLASIEDLGDMDVLITDKTGTLTLGAVAFDSDIAFGKLNPVTLGMLATDVDYLEAAKSTVGMNALDAALWGSTQGKAAFDSKAKKLGSLAFDHDRRIASALVKTDGLCLLVSKGSPEDVIARCIGVTEAQTSQLSALYQAGRRVIAVATREMPQGTTSVTATDESGLTLQGFLAFTDPIKPEVQKSLEALANLGIEVKIATGDSAEVAATVCKLVGLSVHSVLTGTLIDGLTDAQLATAAAEASVFARVSPEQKARILRALRSDGKAVGFLGDGVNDAIALHDADVGISVDSATDVAKDAADIVLLEKDLGVLATGVRQGRRVFQNTMKYVLMGTAGDFGNMVSAAIGGVILPFLPMAPGQLLLQALMYDTSQLGIPTDNVDAEQSARPSHWSIKFIGRFMIVFGLASSVFDFATFALMIFGFHAKVAEFQTGWFVESLATATLIVLAVRTRRVPFWRSRPSRVLLVTVLVIVGLGVAVTYLPLGRVFDFAALPLPFFGALLGMILGYLVLVEFAKRTLFRSESGSNALAHKPNRYRRGQHHRVSRRASKFVGVRR